ncbi:MAG: alpha-amylase family glycosyl hydrolase [Verrucomicrobiota bacterium JB024]|nr:alpha-amylase family glycosyl hydrolase [Verrucomicrobiota bacterium JB024]
MCADVFFEAKWESHQRGVVFLNEDWKGAGMPPLFLNPGKQALKKIERAAPQEYAKLSGYYAEGKRIVFFLWPEHFPNLDWQENTFYVAGEFNGWEKAIGKPRWHMTRDRYQGRLCFTLSVPARLVCTGEAVRFKFVTGDGDWQMTPLDAPNREVEGDGTHPFLLDPKRTGARVFYFEPPQSHHILGHEKLLWKDKSTRQECGIAFGHLLLALGTDAQLGVLMAAGKTIFRLFAPRATRVTVCVYKNLDGSDTSCHDLVRVSDNIWERVHPGNLHGWYYHYSVDGEDSGNFSHFDPDFKILDPYALAAVSHVGPGIIYDPEKLPRPHHRFKPPAWHDLVIMEAHVRDLLAHAEADLSPADRQGFAGLAKWLRSGDCYLKDVGVNAVELQPVQENDARSRDEYHWGYMTCNYFAPESSYGTEPEKASQIHEFKDVVDAFHEQNMAVILDVVYNHVGEPAHLLFIDKLYYFETDHKGNLMNWSGCGNDFSAHTPMGRRLMIDSLVHLVKTYDVDGFRFDLAELIGVDVLKDVEKALKAVKPSIILIAEPWSFRGHIAQALRHTGFSSWNDGYRDFVARYVKGEANRDQFRYFISGSPHYFAMFPAQTVNYASSHDDRCWLDKITENAEHNASWPTANDRRRTHLMCALLMTSLGIPMLAEGDDLLRSKQGVNNSYQRGDLNALDYSRQRQYPATAEYFRRWIAFRRSAQGKLFRLDGRQSNGYLKFYEDGDTSAIAVLYNADHTNGREQILFAINPHFDGYALPLSGLAQKDFRQLADHERFDSHGLTCGLIRWEDDHLHLPPMSCGLWVKK